MKQLQKGKDHMIAGVCGGIADTYDVDPTLVRAVFVVLSLTSVGVLLYIVLAIIMPE